MGILHLVVLFCLSTSRCTVIKSSRDAVTYLRQFGYISRDVTNFRFPVTDQGVNDTRMFSKSISTFQMYAGLNKSGQFDNETMNMMNLPRCGMAERMEIMENKYINMSTLSHKIPRRRKWKASTIYYRIANFPTSFQIDPLIAREEIRKAFRLWEEVANIRCIEIGREDTKQAEIDILFVSRDHGDGNAFGHQSVANVVAHAFFPDHRHFEGDVHFDNERVWTAFNKSGINLFQVAVHETGHALGLEHSRFPDSVMHMIVKSELTDNFQLHDDDIQGIQKLYGPRRRKRHRGRGHLNGLKPSLVTPTILDNELDQRMSAAVQIQNPLGPVPQSQANIVNVNAFINVPMQGSDKMVSELGPVLQKLWRCFSLSNVQSENNVRQAANCYKTNVIRLLYSLNVV